MSKLPELVVLDIIGTTVDDRGHVSRAFATALAEQSIQVSPEQLHAIRGLSKRDAMLHLVPDGPGRVRRAEAAYLSFCRCLGESCAAEPVRPIPGAEETFQWLRERGVRIALATGLGRGTTLEMLGWLGWLDSVADAVVSEDDVRQGRPAPYLIFRAMEETGTSSVHTVANVGDTTVDLQAGHNAGVRWNIGVLSGAHDKQVLQQAPHTDLLLHVGELPSLWRGAR
ncbi:MAG: hypothetical protein AMJ46_00250 [Latescibacteria bacterium DG_63]|nr:MAG: hypothetical protein AMJ46_00250 [Latescibacteria bacterium DG_63]